MIETILIVDDSVTVRMNLAELFEAAGFQMVLCDSAAKAREALSEKSISLIILDVVLPDADGVEFLKEIRSAPLASGIPVILLSTEAEVKDRIRGLRTGADEYVGKPYDAGYLVARVRELLHLRASQSESDSSVVLVIDDSVTFREELRKALERSGYSVLTAASGEDGLRAAASHRPSAVIVDGILPGIDGPTVIRRLRLDAALSRIPCMLLTSSDERGAELRALDAGADAFARKDDDLEMLLVRLDTILRNANAPADRLQTRSSLGPKKIMAVDDSITYLNELAEMLSGEGYDVVTAKSGSEALQMLAVQPVDCILLDILMPGLNGEDTCRMIRSSPVLRDTPLIMLTALEDRNAMIRGLGAGADDYISKSSDFEVLKARVRSQLRRKQFEEQYRKVREELLQREIEATEVRAAQQIARTHTLLIEELERKNEELETFSYSVSHDLRAPLRAIDGFSQALLQQYGHALDEKGHSHLMRVRAAAQRMGELIDDLLNLSRVSSAEIVRQSFDISEMTRSIANDLAKRDPEHHVAFTIEDGLSMSADRRLMQIVLENLLGNAWKFTSRKIDAQIEFGCLHSDDRVSYFVRDNGAGFDMTYAEKLFAPFQRLHTERDFPGTGIGLATVRRIIDRHGGQVSAKAALNEGATFLFTVPPERTGGWR